MKENFELAPLKIDIDFHNHTKGSDGRQSSLRFLLRASQHGKNIISMTDHDSVSGYKNLENDLYSVLETIREDKSYNPDKIIELLEKIKILKGTELITSYNGVIVEILGYNFQLDKMEQEIIQMKNNISKKPYEALYEGFCKIIEEKGLVFQKEVLDESLQKIKKEGKGGVVGPFFNELIAHQENLNLLMYKDIDGEEKLADTLKLFINKHLYNRNSPLFVDMSQTRPSFENTIEAIHKAGGKAILAHAGRYTDKFDVKANIDEMISKGLDGLEVYYPDHSYEFREFLLKKVKEHGLIASGGSDDHHYKKEGIQYEIGRVAVPNIPETAWIQESVQNGLDFIKESEKMQEALKELKKLKDERQRKIKEKEQLDSELIKRKNEDKERE